MSLSTRCGHLVRCHTQAMAATGRLSRRLVRRLIGFAALALGTPSIAETLPDRFDLVCEGTTSGRGSGPFQKVVHVDLAANAFCVDACEAVERIHSRASNLITFRDVQSDGYYLVDRATWSPTNGYESEYAATLRAYFWTRSVAICRQTSLSVGSSHGLSLTAGLAERVRNLHLSSSP